MVSIEKYICFENFTEVLQSAKKVHNLMIKFTYLPRGDRYSCFIWLLCNQIESCNKLHDLRADISVCEYFCKGFVNRLGN